MTTFSALSTLALCVLFQTHAIQAYYLTLHALEWYNASIYCQSYCLSHLASVHSTSDHVSTLDIIDRNAAVYTRVWMGLNDIRISDVWVWSDGTPFDHGNIIDSYTGKVVRGTPPWRSDEPDYNDSDQAVALEVGSLYSGSNSRKWVDRKVTANYHFFCNDCSSRLHKFAAVNGARNYTEAERICASRFGTSLASIHTNNDMIEARLACKQLTSSSGCWLGLTDTLQHHVYSWSDGTAWDYGVTLKAYPWYASEPSTSLDQRCVFLDPSNGGDPGEYLWDDYWCYYSKPRALCNAPSEICYPGQFFISRGSPTDWTWTTKPCGVAKTSLVSESVAILANKQFLNTAGELLIDMNYAITEVGLYGNAGVAIYLDESDCSNYYYVGIWGGHSLIFLGKSVQGNWNLITHGGITPTYNTGTYYTLSISLKNGVDWTISLNDQTLLTATDNAFNNFGNTLSGHVALRAVNAAIDVKSLFVSGQPMYQDTASWHLQCTLSPTPSPTDVSLPPTIAPSQPPSSAPTNIPSISPTRFPSNAPSEQTSSPTTAAPTHEPTTSEPSMSPTADPSVEPTENPSVTPTKAPTLEPTGAPSQESNAPTLSPTYNPTKVPTLFPSFNPTVEPTLFPTHNPSMEPTLRPTTSPQTTSTGAPPHGTAKNNNTSHHNANAVMTATRQPRNQLIWIIGIPIGLVGVIFFGGYLGYHYWLETQEEGKKDEKKEEEREVETSNQSERESLVFQAEPNEPGSALPSLPTSTSARMATEHKDDNTLGVELKEDAYAADGLIIPGTPRALDESHRSLTDREPTTAGESEMMLVSINNDSDSSEEPPVKVNYRLKAKYHSK